MSNTADNVEVLPPRATKTDHSVDTIDQLWNIWERDLSDLHYKGIDTHRRVLELFDARIIRVQLATDRSIAASLEINMRYVEGLAPEVTYEILSMPPRMKPERDYIYNVWQRYTNLCAQGRRLFDLRKAGRGQYRPLRTEVDSMEQQMEMLQKDLAHYELLLKEAKAQFNRDQPPATLFDPPTGQDRPDDSDSPRRDPPADNAGAPSRPHRRPGHGGVCTFDCGYCLALHLGVLPTREKDATALISGRDTPDRPITHEVIVANIPFPRNPDARAESEAGYNEDLADTCNVPYPDLPPLPPSLRSDRPARTDGPAQRTPPRIPSPGLPGTKDEDVIDQTRESGLRGGTRPKSPICISPTTVISIYSDEDDLSPSQTPGGYVPPPSSVVSSRSSSASDHTVNRLDLQLTSTNDSDQSRTLVGSQSPPSLISISSSGSTTSSSGSGSSSEPRFPPGSPRPRPIRAGPLPNAQKQPDKPIDINPSDTSSPSARTRRTWTDGAWHPPPPSTTSISSSSSSSSSDSSFSFDFNGPILVPSTTTDPTSTQNQTQRTTTPVANSVSTLPPNTNPGSDISSSQLSRPSIVNPEFVQTTIPQPQTTTKRIYIEHPLLTPPLDIDLADYEFTNRTRKPPVPPGNVSKHAQSNTGQNTSNGNTTVPRTGPNSGVIRGSHAGLGFKNIRSRDDIEIDSISSGSSSHRPGGFSEPTSDSDVSLDLIISRGSGWSNLGNQRQGQRDTQKGGQKNGQQQQNKLRTKPVPFMHGGVHVNWNGNPGTGINTGSRQNGKNRNQGKNYKDDDWSGNRQSGSNSNGKGHGNGNNGKWGKKHGNPSLW